MSFSCRKCGGPVEEINPKKPWPHTCKQCKLIRQREYQREYARKSGRRLDWSLLQCAKCNQPITAMPRAGRPSRYCNGCIGAVKKQQHDDARRKREREGTGKIHRHDCQKCGVKFDSSDKRRLYCSHGCRRLAQRNRMFTTCLHCQKPFEHLARLVKPRVYCSRACFNQYRSVPPCKCRQCGKEFRRKYYKHEWQGKNIFCSRECSIDSRWGKGRPHKCGSDVAKLAWSQRTRATTVRRRCKYYGCPCDVTCTREIVCNRDGWICQKCGIQCHKGKQRTDALTRKVDPRSAEHDHIWALSVRGSPGNVLGNSQCLCRRCNSKKRNKGGGQLRLCLTG